jgi:hypothetical protein
VLTIREAQFAALAEYPRARFERALASHLGRYFPHECERGDVPRFVRLGIERSEYHGCETQLDVAYYVNLMVMLGCDFDRDPQIPWAGDDLDNPSVPSLSVRLSRAYDAALRYLEETGGDGNSHLTRAMLRIRRDDTAGLDGLDDDALPEGILGFLAALYPEKTRYQGEAAMEALVDAAIESARGRGASTGRAVGIHALHMFMLGAGYGHDPLYFWLNRLLDDDGSASVDARYDNLMKASIAYIEIALRKQNPEE